MTDTNGFEALGIDDRLVEHVRELGYLRPGAFQREAIPVIARGTTAVGIASAGCGKTLACALGLAGRVEPEASGTQALVLRPTDEAAAATAESLYRALRASGIGVLQVRPGIGEAAADLPVAVASPATALTAVERSAIKLEEIHTLIVDGASAIFGLGGGEALETVTGGTPKEAQRVLLTAERTPAVEGWIEGHARRARQLLPAEAVEPLTGATIEHFAGPPESWIRVLTSTLDAVASKGVERSVIHCRREHEAEALADALVVRGFRLADEPDEPGVHVVWGELSGSRPGDLAVSWGTPLDAAALRARAEEVERSLVLLEPRELPHLQRLASSLEIRLETTRIGLPTEGLRSLQETRDRLRDAARERDLEPYLLLLEPLLEDLGPAELAAAATALLREGAPVEERKRKLPAWTRLFFGVGRQDGVRPADIVGAVTGESAVSGDQLGRIEIRDTHTLVEVEADVADRVIRGLSTATIRGRPARVRLYRE